MSPRVVHLPLSGSLRSVQAKGIRQAHGLADGNRARAEKLRGEAQAKVLEAIKLECEAWSALMWAGGPAQPSPTYSEAISAGFVILQVQCGACYRRDEVDLRTFRMKSDKELWKLEASLSCNRCKPALGYRPKAHIVALKREETPAPHEDRKMARRARRGQS